MHDFTPLFSVGWNNLIAKDSRKASLNQLSDRLRIFVFHQTGILPCWIWLNWQKGLWYVSTRDKWQNVVWRHAFSNLREFTSLLSWLLRYINAPSVRDPSNTRTFFDIICLIRCRKSNHLQSCQHFRHLFNMLSKTEPSGRSIKHTKIIFNLIDSRWNQNPWQ